MSKDLQEVTGSAKQLAPNALSPSSPHLSLSPSQIESLPLSSLIGRAPDLDWIPGVTWPGTSGVSFCSAESTGACRSFLRTVISPGACVTWHAMYGSFSGA